MKMKKDLPTLSFESQQDLEAWLEENHEKSEGTWIKFAKKNSGIESVSFSEALETAICYGWIDGQAAPFDDAFWLLRFTPRRPKSKWSERNRERAIRLAADGRLRAAGLKEVESAKQDGRWDSAYAPQRTMSVPDDLQKMLDENPKAQEFFDSLDSRNRYAILYRIHEAKRSETRSRRIEKYVSMLTRQQKIYLNR